MIHYGQDDKREFRGQRWTYHLSGLTPQLRDSQELALAIESDSEGRPIGSGLPVDNVVLSGGWLRHG